MKINERGIQAMGTITSLDAMPMVADVIMGVAPRPETFEAHPERVWWHWAVKTQAGRLALATIGCTVPIDRPWFGTTEGWRVQPWVDAEETDTGMYLSSRTGWEQSPILIMTPLQQR